MRTAAVLLGLALLAAPAAAQAPTIPAGAVAAVGSEAITQVTFDHWERVALIGGHLDPPTFARCIRRERRIAKRQHKRPTAGKLRARCNRRYVQTRRDVMAFVVQGLWVTQEAAARHVTVSDRRVRAEFESQRREAFPKPGQFRRFLKSSGLTEADILYRVKLDLLQGRITDDAMKTVAPVTRQDVDRYVARHRRVSRKRARARIRAVREDRALGHFLDDFPKRSKAKTVCAPGYVVSECGATATPAS